MILLIGMLVSSNSKYDKHIRGEAGGELTAAELNGLSIFRSNCSSCHSEPLFSDFSYRNNGLKPSVVNDSGRAVITRTTTAQERADLLSFLNTLNDEEFVKEAKFRQ